MKKAFFVFCFLFTPSNVIASLENWSFEHQRVNSAVYNEVQITCRLQGEEIGSISYIKIPCLNYYVLHTFYIYPEHRNKGYGTQWLNYTCDYLQSIGATKIYIQPGPFEINNDEDSAALGRSRALTLQALINLYKKNRFVSAQNWMTPLIQLMYKGMRIDEKAEYLMVQTT